MEKEIIINNQLNEVTRISQFIEDLGTSLDLPSKLTMGIALAIEEVVTNIIQHTQTDNKPSQIFLQAVIEPGVLAFTITDEGAPLDPNRTVVSPSKTSMEQQIIQEIGHLLIHRIMDEVSYHSDAK
ncbi:ATP-binding protein, partial [Bacteroides sp.]|uniref:ATP-binding protein n=1 Tax=Bacteroides sp. TaxID=29523 RepID=UPI002632F5A3